MIKPCCIPPVSDDSFEVGLWRTYYSFEEACQTLSPLLAGTSPEWIQDIVLHQFGVSVSLLG